MSHIAMIVVLKIPQRGGETHGLRLINAWVHQRHVADSRAERHMRERVVARVAPAPPVAFANRHERLARAPSLGSMMSREGGRLS
jgi:hypothetical protein